MKNNLSRHHDSGETSANLDTNSNESIINRWFQELWVRGNKDILDELLWDDGVAEGILPSIAMNKREFEVLVDALRVLVKDVQIELTHTITSGEWIAARTRVRATSQKSRATVDVNGQLMARIVDGKIVQTVSQFDFLQFFEQLGQLPPDALMVSLTGEKLMWMD